MPHMMNCPHAPEGWCLTCVGRMADELTAWKELAAEASETLHNPADMRPELIGTGEAGLWRLTQDVGSMLCRGPVRDTSTSASVT